MKELFRKIFWPILKPFEQGEGDYVYKPMNRKILILLGCMFIFLATGLVAAYVFTGHTGALLPIVVFGAGGLVCAVVGLLGSERAVAKIWGSR